MSYYVNPHPHSCPWYATAELVGSPNIKWCEETLCHWVSEPANTWSNLLYLIMAFYIYKSAKRTKQPELVWLGPAMFIMGACSFFYHMSNNYVSQIMDFVGMFCFVYWFFILNLRRLGVINKHNQGKVMVAISMVSLLALHLMYINFMQIQVIILVSVAAILVSEYMCYRQAKRGISKKYDLKFFTTGSLFMAVAETFSLLDVNRIICDPKDHIFQGHATWHILGAIGLTLAYKHYEQFNYQKDHQNNFHDKDHSNNYPKSYQGDYNSNDQENYHAEYQGEYKKNDTDNYLSQPPK